MYWSMFILTGAKEEAKPEWKKKRKKGHPLQPKEDPNRKEQVHCLWLLKRKMYPCLFNETNRKNRSQWLIDVKFVSQYTCTSDKNTLSLDKQARDICIGKVRCYSQWVVYVYKPPVPRGQQPVHKSPPQLVPPTPPAPPTPNAREHAMTLRYNWTAVIAVYKTLYPM